MARPYSTKFLVGLSNADSNRVGIQLAKLCVDANIPANSIANFFGVSRMAVHGWFRGNYIREEKCIKIMKFIDYVKRDLDSGDLPAKTTKSTKEYLSNIQDKYL